MHYGIEGVEQIGGRYSMSVFVSKIYRFHFGGW